MANIEDCPGFETFGADVKAARKAKRLSRKTMAEIINVDARYLANIENDGTIPSLPVVIQLIKECGLPVERYFNPEIMREESAQRQRISHKLKLCPEQYLPIIEGAIDGAIQINNPKKKKETGDRPHGHQRHPGTDRRAAKNRRQCQSDCPAYQQHRDCVRAGH